MGTPFAANAARTRGYLRTKIPRTANDFLGSIYHRKLAHFGFLSAQTELCILHNPTRSVCSWVLPMNPIRSLLTFTEYRPSASKETASPRTATLRAAPSRSNFQGSILGYIEKVNRSQLDKNLRSDSVCLCNPKCEMRTFHDQ